MKNLKVLKEEILNNDIKNFNVFCGTDYKVKQHYIQNIKKNFQDSKIVDSISDIVDTQGSSILFKLKTVYIIYDDMDFADVKKSSIQSIINKFNKDDILIFVYNQDISKTTLFKEFETYITSFDEVTDKVAHKLIKKEVNLLISQIEELANNCSNNYGLMLLEIDKIKSLAKQNNMNESDAYQLLKLRKQLIIKYPELDYNGFMNCVLVGDREGLKYYINLIENSCLDTFWHGLHYMFRDCLIAYYVTKYGKYNGGGRAYKLKLAWGRTKEIRELNIQKSPEDLLYMANILAEADKDLKTGRFEGKDFFDYFLAIII